MSNTKDSIRKEQWRKLSSDLSFNIHEGFESILQSSFKDIILKDTLKGQNFNMTSAYQMLNNPLFKMMTSHILVMYLQGKYNGYNFHIFPTTKSSQSGHSSVKIHNSTILLEFNTKYELGLNISPSKPSSRFFRKIFKKNVVRIPHHPELDRLLIIKASNKIQAQTLLSDQRICDSLFTLFSYSKSFQIKDWGIKYEVIADCIDLTEAINTMDIMSQCAALFY